MVEYGGIWRHGGIYGDIWWNMVVYGGIWRHGGICGGIWGRGTYMSGVQSVPGSIHT